MSRMLMGLSKIGNLCPLSIAMRGKSCTAVLAVFLFFLLFSSVVFANGITLSNVSVVGWDTTAHTAQVKFDITWNNAWRDSTNYDAAWVFIKYSTDAGATWNHATLAHQGHKCTSGIEIVLPTEPVTGYKGAFIQFSASVSSPTTLTANGTKFVWDYGKDGLTDNQAKDSTNTLVKVFGIEMVYIPTGSFYIGDGNGSSESSYAFHEVGHDNTAAQITTSSKNITVDSNSDDDIDTTPVAVSGATGITGNVSWPTGYNAFYLMKYELSQGQYVDFLNTLRRNWQQTRVVSNISGSNVTNYYVMTNTSSIQYRNTIQCPSSGNGTTNPIVFSTGSRDSRAVGYLSWPDVMAYADWASLRPMTELEYEKAARGPSSAVYGEYAWGSTSITQCTTISGTENGTEICTTSNANSNYTGTTFSGGDGGQGALRVGIFATSSTTTRAASGAGYYGNMDLTGSIWERCVTLGNATGRAFQGTHGDGVLASPGNADVVDWPGYSSGAVTGATGTGFHGGAWDNLGSAAQVSNRVIAANVQYADRFGSWGGRLARTAK